MKLKRGTVMLVGVALLLGAGVLMGELRQSRTPESAPVSDGAGPVFDFAETDVAKVTVERNGETLSFEGDGEGNWQMTVPENLVAEPGAVAFLLSRLNTDSPLQRVTMAADQIQDFGLDQPQGQVTVTLKDGTEHVLILGGPDFSGNANYAVIDPDGAWPPESPTGEYDVLVVTRDVANGIKRPLAEWKMPVDGENGAAGETPDGEAPSGESSDNNLPLEMEIPEVVPDENGAAESENPAPEASESEASEPEPSEDAGN